MLNGEMMQQEGFVVEQRRQSIDLTCVINVRNGERYLRETLVSVSRVGSEVKILVVDNQSTDGTSSIVADFGAVRYVKTPESLSLGAARNYSLQFVTSEYLTWLDADDKWMPGFLASYSMASQRFPEAVMISSGSVIIDSEGGILPARMQRFLSRETELEIVPGDSLERLMDRIGFGDAWCSYVFKTSALKEVGGLNTRFEFAEDIDVIGRLLAIGSAMHIEKNLTFLRYHPQQMTLRLSPSDRAKEILQSLRNAAACSGRSFDRQLKTAEVVLRFKSALQLWFLEPLIGRNLAEVIRSGSSYKLWRWTCSYRYIYFALQQGGLALNRRAACLAEVRKSLPS